ncbi:MAG: ABC transporter substrate-binding protein [Pseudonocardia sp. SCN 72-86]|nr:MAG: ABC transporter substrate-binding protein [Pseudonocardia sp. SCN 72-86]
MARHSRLGAIAALGVAVCTLLAGCGGSSGGGGSSVGGSDAPIIIGSLHPLSGAYAADGQQIDNGAKIAVDEINAAGGIKSLAGRKLQLSSGDTKGSPETGQSEAQRLIQSGAVGLIGAYQSSVSATVAAVAERNTVPFIIDISNDVKLLNQGYKYSFRIQPNSDQFANDGATYLKEISDAAGKPVTKVALLHEQTAFGTAVAQAFVPKAASLGITVDPVISYDAANVSDLTTQVARAKAAGAQVIAAAGYYRDGVLLAQAINSVKPDLLAVYGVADGAFDIPTFSKDAAPQGEGYIDVSYHIDSTKPYAHAFTKAYQDRFNDVPRTGAGYGYDSVKVIAAGLEKAASDDPTKLRDAIAGASVDAVTASAGPIEFLPNGENKNAQPVVMQVQGGKPLQVYPKSLAEKPIIFPVPPTGTTP